MAILVIHARRSNLLYESVGQEDHCSSTASWGAGGRPFASCANVFRSGNVFARQRQGLTDVAAGRHGQVEGWRPDVSRRAGPILISEGHVFNVQHNGKGNACNHMQWVIRQDFERVSLPQRVFEPYVSPRRTASADAEALSAQLYRLRN